MFPFHCCCSFAYAHLCTFSLCWWGLLWVGTNWKLTKPKNSSWLATENVQRPLFSGWAHLLNCGGFHLAMLGCMTSGLHLVWFLCGHHKLLLNPWPLHWDQLVPIVASLLASGWFELLHSSCSWSRIMRISPEHTGIMNAVCRCIWESEAWDLGTGWEERGAQSYWSILQGLSQD